MATYIQRADAIFDALTDPTVLTAAQRTKNLDNVLAEATDAQILAIFPNAPRVNGIVDRSQVTAAQKAQVFVTRLRYELRKSALNVKARADEVAAAALIAAGASTADSESGMG
jgi:hypothetical protein